MSYCTVCQTDTSTNMSGLCIVCHHLKEVTRYCPNCKRQTIPIDNVGVLHCMTCGQVYISENRISDFIEEVWRGIFQKRPGIINKIKFKYIADKIYKFIEWWKGKK